MILVESVKEAMDSVLSFTKSAEELLRRKKVYRELIFKYLANEGVIMPSTSEKHALIKKTLELWSSRQTTKPQGQTGNNQDEKRTETDSTEVKTDPDFDLQILGQQFCQWFFGLLNSQNPAQSQGPQDWGPEHFWPDAKLNLLARVSGEQMEEFVGADVVSSRLVALTREERLLFQPNLEGHGLKGLSSPHGLVLVAVAGTIHRDSSCLGIFEQIFGLIKSPVNNTWKIKFANLKIRGQDAITDKDVSAPALTYNSSDLQLICSGN
uniref:NTF2 domain-containing protein n=1 Tax=Knipowitschia caucasica TaxID=637954 RepID=A0AAV2K322_KNICA